MVNTTDKTRGWTSTSSARLYDVLMRRPKFVPAAFGFAVAFIVLAAGLSLMGEHGGNWPWWFHGVVIAAVTGVFAGLVARLQIREVKAREARLAAGKLISHEMGNALQVLLMRASLDPERRVQHEDEAIERIRLVMREIMPDVLDIPSAARPSSWQSATPLTQSSKHKAAN